MKKKSIRVIFSPFELDFITFEKKTSTKTVSENKKLYFWKVSERIDELLSRITALKSNSFFMFCYDETVKNIRQLKEAIQNNGLDQNYFAFVKIERVNDKGKWIDGFDIPDSEKQSIISKLRNM